MSGHARRYWHDFTHPIIGEAGDNDEEIAAAEDVLGIPGDVQEAAEAVEEKIPATVTPSKRKQDDYPEEEPDVKPPPEKEHAPRQEGSSLAKAAARGKMRGRRSFGGRRSYGRRRRFVRRRFKRRYGRRRFGRKRTWSKRVRRSALKLHESKRHNRQIKGDLSIRTGDMMPTPSAPRVYYFELANVDDYKTSDGTIEELKSHRVGRYTYATGTSIKLYLRNKLTTTTLWVRVILGYKKLDRENESSNEFSEDNSSSNPNDADAKRYKIFKTTVGEKNCSLNQWQDNGTFADRENFQVMDAPLDKKYIRVWKDYKFRLLGNEDESHHRDALKSKLYWNHRNRMIKWEDDGVEKTDDVNWMPAMWVYLCSADMTGGIGPPSLQMQADVTHYFKDP